MKYVDFAKKTDTDGLLPFYILEGTDMYWLYAAYRKLLSFAVDDMDISVFSDFNVSDFEFALCNLTMSGGTRFVVFRDYKFKTEGAKSGKKSSKKAETAAKKTEPTAVSPTDELKAFLHRIPEGCCFIMFNCTDHGITENRFTFDKLSPAELRPYVERLAKSKGLEFAGNAAGILMEYCLYDMTMLDTELTKLGAYGRTPVTAALIEATVIPAVSYQYYEFADKVASGKYAAAYGCLDYLTQGKDAEKVRFISSLATYYRSVWFTKFSGLTDEALAAKLKKHPYAVKLARQVGAKYGADELNALLRLLYGLEFRIKSGKISVGDAVDLAIAEAIVKKK